MINEHHTFSPQFYSGEFFASIFIAVAASIIIGSLLHYIVAFFPEWLKKRWSNDALNYLHATYPHANILLFKDVLTMEYDQPKRVPLFYWVIRRVLSKAYRVNIAFPYIELFTVVITIATLFCFDMPANRLAVNVLCYGLIVLMFIDFQNYILPDELTLLLLWLGLIFNCGDLFIPLKDAVIGAVAGYSFLSAIYWLALFITKKECLGYGDFKLFAALGAWFGWQELTSILFLASLLALCFVVVLLLSGQRNVINQPIAFGGYLSLSAITILFKNALL